jgi:hypothetical protein
VVRELELRAASYKGEPRDESCKGESRELQEAEAPGEAQGGGREDKV